MTQESFSHGGYRGTLKGLLIHVRNGVEMMRRVSSLLNFFLFLFPLSHSLLPQGYPENVQAAFDRFRDRIDALVGEDNEEGGECHLVIRDPSGLSRVHGGDKVSSSGKKVIYLI